MRLVIRGRQRGKTTAIVEEMVRTPGSVVVVATTHDVHSYRDLLCAAGIPLGEARARVFTGKLGALRAVRPPPTRVFVDNADLVLAALLGQQVDVATMTAEQPPLEPVDPERLLELERRFRA